MQTALIILGCSMITLAFFMSVFRVEDARGGRLLLLPTLRSALDSSLLTLVWQVNRLQKAISQYLVHAVRHHLVRFVLGSGLWVVRSIEKVIEQGLRKNAVLERKYSPDREKNHLDYIAEHKVETALSDREKQRLRSHY